MSIKLQPKKIFLPLLFFSIVNFSAQNAILSSFGEVTNSEAKISYSIGQVISGFNSLDEQGSIYNGIQIPFEITSVLNLQTDIINIEVQTYPNPTTDFLNIKIKDFNKGGFEYQLYDIKGVTIEKEICNSSLSVISMKSKPIGFYFLKITNNQNLVQIFKIVKK